MIEHVLSGRLGWRVSIIRSRENDNWGMKIEGPKGFQKTYTLVGGKASTSPTQSVSYSLNC
jgi:hypothetical protein